MISQPNILATNSILLFSHRSCKIFESGHVFVFIYSTCYCQKFMSALCCTAPHFAQVRNGCQKLSVRSNLFKQKQFLPMTRMHPVEWEGGGKHYWTKSSIQQLRIKNLTASSLVILCTRVTIIIFAPLISLRDCASPISNSPRLFNMDMDARWINMICNFIPPPQKKEKESASACKIRHLSRHHCKFLREGLRERKQTELLCNTSESIWPKTPICIIRLSHLMS